MKHLFLLFATYLALAVNVACGESLTVGDWRMPLMWLPIVLALQWFGDWRGILWSACIGHFADGLSDGRLGLEMLATTLAAILALPLRPDDDVRSRWAWIVWQFSVIATGLILSQGLTTILSNGPAVTLNSLIRVAGEAALGLVLCGLFGIVGVGRARKVVHSYHA